MQVFDHLRPDQNAWFAFRDEESGQTLVEYALIISLVALACIPALGFLSGKIQALFSRRRQLARGPVTGEKGQ